MIDALGFSNMSYWRSIAFFKRLFQKKGFRNFVTTRWVTPFLVLFCMGMSQTVQAAQGVTLAWQASPDSTVVGNRIHYGTASGVYTTTVDVGNVTTATLSGLTAGVTYYYVVTAYNSQGGSSLPSNEVSGVVLGNPTVSLFTPNNRVNFNGPSVIALSATASEIGGSIAKVDFYSSGSMFAESTGIPFTAQWKADQGNHTLTAVAYDANGVSAQSSPVSVTITEPRIRSVKRMGNGSTQLTLSGAPGWNNSVYVSNDLNAWSLLGTVLNTSGTAVIQDSQSTNASHRYYRMTAE